MGLHKMLNLPLGSSTSISASSAAKHQYIRTREHSANPRSTLSFSRSIIQGQRFNEGKQAALIPKRFVRATKIEATTKSDVTVKEKSVSVVLLAGGKGKRMGVNMPKQFLPLIGQPIALYSFFTFCEMKEVKEIVVVCDPSYRVVFEDASDGISVELKFGKPGKERQDSVFNGLQEIDGCSELICIHDSARPLVSSSEIEKVIKDAWLYGAAVLGVPAKATIKEANSESFVVKTLDRKTLWEMQTPQVMKPELLRKGFELVNKNKLEVTDDVSIVEHLKHPVYITKGSYTNIKVTTPDDLLLAERILNMKA